MAFSHNIAAATDVIVYNLTLTTLNTQYSQVLPNGCKAFAVSIRDGVGTDNYRVAFVTDKVATPTEPYLKFPANVEYSQDGVYLEGKTIYIACSAGSKVAQIECWV